MLRIVTIAVNTYRESVRSKILYSVFFFALAMLVLSAFFGTVTIGERDYVIKNFGLFSMSFFTVAYAVISGAALLYKELSKKTIYNVLSKSVKRSEFLYGKYFGMLLTTLLLILIMGIALLLFTAFFSRSFDFLLLQAYVGIFFQLMIVCALAIFFSSLVVTPLLSGAFTFGVFLAGRSTEFLFYFINNGQVEGAKAGLMKSVYYLLPHLNKLDYSDSTVYGNIVSTQQYAWGFLYAVGYSGVLLILANFCFKNKEFN